MRFLFLFPILFLGYFSHPQVSKYTTLNLDENLTENADAVVRLDEMEVELLSQRKMIVRKKRIVTVLNSSGNQFTQAYLQYDDGIKVNDIQAKIFDKDGHQLDKMKRSDFKTISAISGGTLYSDAKIMYMDYKPVNYPYTLEYTMETTTQNTGLVPSWNFLDGFRVSTQESKYSILYPTSELKPEIREKNIEGLKISKSETADRIEYHGLHIPAIKNEDLAPSFGSVAPHLMTRMTNFHYEGYDGKISTWKDVGIWANAILLEGRNELPESTKVKMRSLVSEVIEDIEKAKIIYKYVQENTRYVSVQIGIGGKQPVSAMEVDRVKYGDCKGLTNYTKALLESVGVTSFYAQVKSGTDKIDLDEEFATLWQSDHIILALPYKEGYLWTDCTSQIHPFGFIGDFTDHRKALIIKPEGGELVTTTSYLNEQNHQYTKGHYTLRNNGSIVGLINIRTKGIQYDKHFRLKTRSEDEIIKHYKNYWENLNGLSIKSFEFQNDADTVAFTEKLSLDATNYATRSGQRLLFAPNVFNRNTRIPDRYRNRKHPFEIQRGFLDEDEVIIQIPKDYAFEAVPEAVTIENKFGSYSMEFEKIEESILLKRRFLVKKGGYPNTEYEAYRDFLKAVNKHDNAKIVIKSIL